MKALTFHREPKEKTTVRKRYGKYYYTDFYLTGKRIVRKVPGSVSNREIAQQYKNNLIINLKRAARKAGIKKSLTVHMLRYTYASHLVVAEVDLVTVKELLGHSDIQQQCDTPTSPRTIFGTLPISSPSEYPSTGIHLVALPFCSIEDSTIRHSG